MIRPPLIEIGDRFGRLTVIADEGTDKRSHYWRCRCECGNEIVTKTASLRSGQTKSCGCISVDRSKKAHDNPKFNAKLRDFIDRDSVDGTRLSTLDSNRMRNNNTSGVRGVIWDKARSKWRAQIHLSGKDIYLGRFDKKEDAIAARKAAEEKLFQPVLNKWETEKGRP